MAVGFQHRAGPTLGELRARLQGVKGATFRTRLAQNLAEEARHQVDESFREERDPYGMAWEPLKRRAGKILQDTGRMAASVATAQVSGDGFRIVIGATYAKYHQLGTKPFAVRERSARQNRRGRFVRANARGRVARVVRLSAHTNPGLPRRQMLPSSDRGGLGSIWSKAFAKVTKKMLDAQLAGAA